MKKESEEKLTEIARLKIQEFTDITTEIHHSTNMSIRSPFIDGPKVCNDYL